MEQLNERNEKREGISAYTTRVVGKYKARMEN